MTVPSQARRRIAIIGSGFSGLCLGIKLKEAGIHDFTIYEKEDRVGGTWRDNSYPGAACDLPSMAYCFSFEQKTDWTRKVNERGYNDNTPLDSGGSNPDLLLNTLTMGEAQEKFRRPYYAEPFCCKQKNWFNRQRFK